MLTLNFMSDIKNVFKHNRYWLTPVYRSSMTSPGPQNIIKMSSVMPFAYNAVEVYVVTINEKPWTRAREVCKALRYEKAARRVVRHHCTRENIQHKHQLPVVPTVSTTVNWPRDSQKLDLYINEEGMYELLFSSQQPQAKDFKKTAAICCFLMFDSSLETKYRKNTNKLSQAVSIKFRPLSLQMKPINRKF